MNDDLPGWGEFIVEILIIALAALGTYFVAGAVIGALTVPASDADPALLGLQRLETLFNGSGNAALGAALYLGAILMVLALAFPKMLHNQRQHNELLERQEKYLRFLAEQARKTQQ